MTSTAAPAPSDTAVPDDLSATYSNLSFTPGELASAMRDTYDELITFVSQPAFRVIYEELSALAPAERPKFINDVIVNRAELERRGVRIPAGVLVQTSAFGDRRPNLFAVKKFLPERFHAAWENVNLTFDNEHDDKDVSHDPEMAWRKPLPVAIQSHLIATNAALDDFPDVGAADPNWSQALGRTYYTRDG